jgi:hypothetical protein
MNHWPQHIQMLYSKEKLLQQLSQTIMGIPADGLEPFGVWAEFAVFDLSHQLLAYCFESNIFPELPSYETIEINWKWNYRLTPLPLRRTSGEYAPGPAACFCICTLTTGHFHISWHLVASCGIVASCRTVQNLSFGELVTTSLLQHVATVRRTVNCSKDKAGSELSSPGPEPLPILLRSRPWMQIQQFPPISSMFQHRWWPRHAKINTRFPNTS